jgi:hypothetical protein
MGDDAAPRPVRSLIEQVLRRVVLDERSGDAEERRDRVLSPRADLGSAAAS